MERLSWLDVDGVGALPEILCDDGARTLYRTWNSSQMVRSLLRRCGLHRGTSLLDLLDLPHQEYAVWHYSHSAWALAPSELINRGRPIGAEARW
jgi:hypothetical protein